MYRTFDNSLPAAAAESPPASSTEAEVPLFDDPQRNEVFVNAMGYVIAELRRKWKRDIRRMERRPSRRLAEAPKGSDVLDLPKNFWRRQGAA
jgi:hypothetical protein